MTKKTPPPSSTPDVASDLLRGAEEIAEFLFPEPEQRRSIYHLSATSRLPVFRLGSVICARKSTLLKWITEQEQRAMQGKSGMPPFTEPESE